MEWKEVRLGDVCEIKHGFAYKGKYFSDTPTCDILVTPGNFTLSGGFKLDKPKFYNGPVEKDYILSKGDLIVTMTDLSKNIDTLGYSALVPEVKGLTFHHNQRIGLVENIANNVDKYFLYWIMRTPAYQSFIATHSSGTTVHHTSPKGIGNYVFKLPPLDDQRRIASILSSLDRKIELNNKINADLEEMAQAIFKNWFVDFEPFKNGKFVDSELGMIPEGWKVGRLTEIASYMNGLAMQKFPPENDEDSLPVLKIKELGQGFCGPDSDRCSCNIKDECKVHNGDVIFSWSGTLLVDVWCGGDCGLNQHLFKVTSKEYPKWFYYYWTKHHLQEFIHIAKDKAVTMGHIKRGHLEEALVAIPDNDSMERAHELFEPILSKMISLRLENSRLSLLRDTLLPRLMSGELEVPE